MEDYLGSKPTVLVNQAREQITWYRQSIDALDFVGAVACRRALGNRTTLSRTLPARIQLPRNRPRHGI